MTIATESTADAATTDPFSVRGKVVVITGATSGLGEALARHLAAADARVVIAGRRTPRLHALATELGDVLAVTADVTSADDRRAIVDEAVDKYGRIDALVNNAGITNGLPAAKETDSQFREVVDVNLVAPFAMATAALPYLRTTEGAVVNVASIAGLASSGLYIPQASYCASKAGVVNLTRELAVQWGRYGIRVNAVAPGFFPTEMTAPLQDGTSPLPDWMAGRLALRRAGEPAELASAVRFLLSPAAAYVTGAILAVDGGYSAT